jgi:hypothetical protein
MAAMNLPDDYFQSSYASADFLDAETERPEGFADTALIPIGDGTGNITLTVRNLLRKHTSEIRDAAQISLSGSASGVSGSSNIIQSYRRKLREFFLRNQQTIFQFLEQPVKDVPVVSAYTTIMNRFGSADFSISGAPIKDLALDISGDSVLPELEERLGFSLGNFTENLGRFLQALSDITDEIMRLESALKQKTEAIDKLIHNVQGVLTLGSKNPAYEAVIKSTEDYIKAAISENALEATYNSLIGEYKKLTMLREAFLGARLVAGAAATEPLCSVCISEPVNYTFAPCGHTFCQGCMRKQSIQCFICRQVIRERVKLYFS